MVLVADPGRLLLLAAALIILVSGDWPRTTLSLLAYMGRSVHLHPLAALFGVACGRRDRRYSGRYLSIPVMASLRIVWTRWRIYAEKRKFDHSTKTSCHAGTADAAKPNPFLCREANSRREISLL